VSECVVTWRECVASLVTFGASVIKSGKVRYSTKFNTQWKVVAEMLKGTLRCSFGEL
jgi:hypothetical protein